MQTISTVYQLKKGEKVQVLSDRNLLANTNPERNTQFMGWLLKTSELGIVFGGDFNKNHHTTGTVTYSNTYQNLGNGLNIADGSFTAPVSGIYYFHFQGLTDTEDSNLISIKLNGKTVASTFRNKRKVK